jgi:adsorption protein B
MANAAAFLWRIAMRFAFTAREYGMGEGLRAVLRLPLANVIAIIAGRRAVFAYARTLGGRAAVWDKTEHDAHPASLGAVEAVPS